MLARKTSIKPCQSKVGRDTIASAILGAPRTGVCSNRLIEGLLSPEFILDVAGILEAAKISARTGRTVKLTLEGAAGGVP